MPNLSQFYPKATCFLVNSHFETSAPNDPKMTLNTKRSNVLHTCNMTAWTQLPNLSQFSFNMFKCSSYRPIWDKCTEWPQMTFNTKRGVRGITYTCYNYPCVPYFTPFRSTTAVFKLQAIFRQVHWMTRKWTETLEIHRYPIYMWQIQWNTPRVPNFTPFHSTANHFRVTGHSQTSEPNDRKMTLNIKDQR